jgi:hypothetical protein
MLALSCATAVAAAASTVVADPAHADGPTYWRNTKASGRYLDMAGSVEFKPRGEHFIIHDNATDGAGQRVEWRIMGVQQQAIEWHGGSGWHDFNRSVRDGDEIEFRICLMDDGVIKYGTCSLYLIAYA